MTTPIGQMLMLLVLTGLRPGVLGQRVDAEIAGVLRCAKYHTIEMDVADKKNTMLSEYTLWTGVEVGLHTAEVTIVIYTFTRGKPCFAIRERIHLLTSLTPH